MRKCLMLGAGHSPLECRIKTDYDGEREWTTLDINPDCNPDYVFDLWLIESGGELPCSGFDEIHAYEVMEHFGRQGDYRGFFNTFNAIWRALNEEGLFFSSSPLWKSPWAWGDPGHTRIVGLEQITYVCKSSYEKLGSTPITDYRKFVDPHWWEMDFGGEHEYSFYYILRKLND